MVTFAASGESWHVNRTLRPDTAYSHQEMSASTVPLGLPLPRHGGEGRGEGEWDQPGMLP